MLIQSLKRITIFILLLLLISIFVGCALSPQSSKNPDSFNTGIPITVSFYPHYFLVTEIGKEYVAPTSIVQTGVEPHDFEPTPGDVSRIMQSKLFIYHGAGFDQWAHRIAEQVDPNKVHILEISKGFNLLSAQKEDDHDEPRGNDGAISDPHIWLDPVLMQKAVEKVADALVKIDPDHRDEYIKNANALTGKLDALHKEYESGLSSCRLRTAVTAHTAFGYLAHRYNFNEYAVTGISPHDEPSVQELKKLIMLLKAENIRYVLFESLASSRLAQTLADEVGAKSLILNPIEGLTKEQQEEGEDYFSLMRKNLITLRTAMECQ